LSRLFETMWYLLALRLYIFNVELKQINTVGTDDSVSKVYFEFEKKVVNKCSYLVEFEVK